MNVIYKILPYSILLIAAGYLIGMGAGATIWGYIGLGLIITSGVVTLGVVVVLTFIHWRRNKATADKRFSEVSVTLIFNAVVTLLLFAYTTWKDIEILSDDNMFLIIWMGINLGALRIIWVPKETESTPIVQREEVEEEKNEEAV
jgi:accessory gene regulator protein AgrB